MKRSKRNAATSVASFSAVCYETWTGNYYSLTLLLSYTALGMSLKYKIMRDALSF